MTIGVGLAGQTDRVRCGWRCTVSRPSRGRFHICYCWRDFCGGGRVRAFVRIGLALIGAALALAAAAVAQKPPLLSEKEVAALANEFSGETAKRNLEGIARFHRQRGSKGFHEAAELVAERARAYGLSDVAILQFPADGKIFYGTQRSRPSWDADVGELIDITSGGPPPCNKEKIENRKIVFNTDCEPPYEHNIASYEAEPVVLAEDSESADVTADLVDVGQGTKESDYLGKDVKGKIVLVSAQPGAVQDLAVGKFGAAGIVSYAQNQKTAWWGEDENLIRWGHLETFSANKTFAFMVSLKTAREMRERLARGEKIRLHAVAKAGQHAGNYEVVTATLLNAKPQFAKRIKAVIHMDMVGGGPETKAVFHVTRGPMSLPSFVHDVAWAFAEF